MHNPEKPNITDNVAPKPDMLLKACWCLRVGDKMALWFVVCRFRLLQLRSRVQSLTAILCAIPLLVYCGNTTSQPGPATVGKTYQALGPLWPEFVILPPGFQYRIIADESTIYSDGTPRPGDADGMGAFPGPFGSTVLCVSHELNNGETPVVPPVNNHYDPIASGGTSVMMVAPDRSLQQAWVSSSGTIKNCAGGTTPWGTWITVEEDETNTGKYSHGWAFEVDPYAPLYGGTPIQIRLDALGRFYKEAVTVDPNTHAVYQTEDRTDSLFYRFMPSAGTFPSGFGAYVNSPGQLGALYIPELPNASLANMGNTFSPQWINVPDPVATTTSTRNQVYLDTNGKTIQPTVFFRGEGSTWSEFESAVYFDCTGGGSSGHLGQIWRYKPSVNELTLVFESNNASILDNPDNLFALPWGDIVICEDSGGDRYLRILTMNGKIIDFARTSISEFAGACWSSSPETLFVNLQSPSITLAIWGPFESLAK
jgi:secreted PhoX family phosphatase